MKRVSAEKEYRSLKGRTVAITGSTGGLGRAVCTHLAELGADLILIDRNRSKSESWGSELSLRYPDIDLKYVTADMSDMSSVKNAAEFLKTNVPDIFISNAGAYRIKRTETIDGMDPLYQINCFAPYCLIKSILPEMKRRGGKVVAVSSISQMMVKIDPNDATGTKIKNEEKAYANSKRVFTISLFEALKRETTVRFTAVHPGISYTNLMTNYPKIISKLIEYPMKLIFMSPYKASLSIVEGIFTECDSYEWIGPRFFGIWGSPKKTKIKKPSAGELSAIKSIIK